MMENGQLVSSEVLPKVAAELKKAALEGGAFEQALKGLRVTEGQLITESQRAGNKIFKSGFSEGLSELYKTISEILKDAGPQLEKLGNLFGKVFKGIAHILKVIEPVLKVFIDNFGILFGAASIARIGMMSTALKAAFLPLTAALFAAEELASLMSDKLVGVTEAKLGYQMNVVKGTTTDLIRREDGSFVNGASSSADPANLKKMTKEDWDKLSAYNKFGYMRNLVYDAVTHGFNGNSSVSEVIKQGNTSGNDKGVVQITNHFHNADATEMRRFNEMQQMHMMGVSK